MSREVSSRSYPECGVPESHHTASHHGNRPEVMAQLAKINAYHVSLFSKFIQKLQATPDGDGSLLDHMPILYGGGISNSNQHIRVNLPVLLVGGGRGTLQGRPPPEIRPTSRRWRTCW